MYVELKWGNKRRRPPGRPRSRCKYNIKMDILETEWQVDVTGFGISGVEHSFCFRTSFSYIQKRHSESRT
jgi:hypothetical protein